MYLIDRINTLLKADAHGVVESLEDRSLLLKQHLREAELAVDQKKACLETWREEVRRLQEAEQASTAALQGLEEDINLAMAGGKEDLARFAIRRLLARREEVGLLQHMLVQRQTEISGLAAQLTTQQAQLEALRVKVRTVLSRSPEACTLGTARSEQEIHEQEVEIELLRRRQSSATRRSEGKGGMR